MGYEVLSIAFLFVLQCDLYQGTSDSNQNVVYELKIPSFAVNNRQPYYNRMPYPYYQPFNNGCNMCKQSRICNRRCSNNNNQFDVRLPENSLSLSVPSVNGQRLNVIFGKPGSQNNRRCNNGKQHIKVSVKMMPNNTTMSNNEPSSVTTSANSTVVNNKEGQQIKAKTTAENPKFRVEVDVEDTNTGETPKNTEVDSEIIATDGEGNVAESKTNATIKKENKGDKDTAQKPPSNDKKDDKAPPPPKDKDDDKGTDKKPPPSNDKNDDEAPPPPKDKDDDKGADKKPPSNDKKDDKAPPPPKDKDDDKGADKKPPPPNDKKDDKTEPAPDDTVEEAAAPVDKPADKTDDPPKDPEDEKDKPDNKTAATDAGSEAAANDDKVTSASDTSGTATSGS